MQTGILPPPSPPPAVVAPPAGAGTGTGTARLIENMGLGPAMIRWFSMSVNGKSVTNWTDFSKAMTLPPDAKFANRPGFVRLMNALTPRPPFQVLIIAEESRLGRESIETAYALKQLVSARVRVFFYLEDRERTLETPIDKFMMSLTAYRGVIVWNQTQKRNQWGQHKQKARPTSDHLRVPAPALRIVAEPIWQAAHARLDRELARALAYDADADAGRVCPAARGAAAGLARRPAAARTRGAADAQNAPTRPRGHDPGGPARAARLSRARVGFEEYGMAAAGGHL
jgi:hypothetical protein